MVLKRTWTGEISNVSVLVAIGVNSKGYRKILGVCEGAKEDIAGWSAFLRHLKKRGLEGVRLFKTDAWRAHQKYQGFPGLGLETLFYYQ